MLSGKIERTEHDMNSKVVHGTVKINDNCHSPEYPSAGMETVSSSRNRNEVSMAGTRNTVHMQSRTK